MIGRLDDHDALMQARVPRIRADGTRIVRAELV